MNKINIVTLIIALFLLVACDTPNGIEKPEGSVSPGSIENVTVDTNTPGQMVIRWDANEPEGSELLYVKAEYYDPYTKKDVVRLGSTYADSLLIPGTFVAGGEYTFKLTPVSRTLNEGTSTTVSAKSTPLPIIYTLINNEVELTADMLATNAQEPSEGPIASSVDRDNGTFFHSAWSVGVNGRHNFQLNLKKELTLARICIQARSDVHTSNVPYDCYLYTSPDGNNWTQVEGTYYFPKPSNGKEKTYLTLYQGPAETDTYHKEDLILPAGTKHIKFEVMSNHDGDAFFNFSEIYLYQIEYKTFDREADAKKVIDGEVEIV